MNNTIKHLKNGDFEVLPIKNPPPKKNEPIKIGAPNAKGES